MTHARINNLSLSDVRARVEEINFGEIGKIHINIKAVYQKNSIDKWELRAAQIRPVNKGHEILVYNYSSDCFVSVTKVFESFDEAFENLIDSGVVLLDYLPPLFFERDLNWSETLIPSHISEFGAPSRHFVADISCEKHGPRRLLQYGLEYFDSDAEFLDIFIEYSSHNNPQVHLVFPDHRAKLVSSDSGVKIEGVANVELLGKIISGEKVIKVRSEDGVDFDKKKADHLELWLVGDAGQLFDYISTSEYPHVYNLPERYSSLRECIENIITEGEGVRVEFKKYVDFVNRDSKLDEISKSVCAFSNSEGGFLLIGVSDHGNVVGVESEVRKNYKATLQEALSRYKDDVWKQIYESLSFSHGVTVSCVKVYGKYILAIEVEKSDEWNFCHSDSVPYLRKGATNFKGTRQLANSIEINRKKNLVDFYS